LSIADRAENQAPGERRQGFSFVKQPDVLMDFLCGSAKRRIRMMGMMGMMGAMMLFMIIGALVFIAALAVVIWLIVSFLNRRQTSPMPYTQPSQNPYQGYEQGYRPPQPMSETYREEERYERSPQPKQQFDQPYIPYPQEQEIPPRS
jgi:predicted lipid-binding transport protein (Tim44 family)